MLNIQKFEKISDLMPAIYKNIPHDYSHIQTETFDRLINLKLSKVKSALNPLFVQVSGIPGAGKSTFCQQFSNVFFLSFDAIMESIPQYRQDLYLLGNAEAFKKWEIPARIIGYELLRRAVNLRCNIVLEHSGVNDAHIQLFQNLKKCGYATAVHCILCSPETAYQRAQAREKITQRFTSMEMITQRFGLLNQYLEQYKKVADNTYLYTTSANKFILKEKYCA